MARSVNDLRVGLSVLAGRHIDDPQSVDVKGRVWAALISEIKGCQIPRQPRMKSSGQEES